MENIQPFNKNAIPFRWGLIIGFISIFIFTVYSMFLMNSGLMGGTVSGILSFILVMVLLGVMATNQRKAMGGYITFKQAFQAIFLSILIMVIMAQVYSFVYTHWIDPGYYDKMKDLTVNMAASFGGDEGREIAEKQALEQMEKQKGITGILMASAMSLIVHSLFGFIVAAIVKKDKPVHLA